MYPIDLQFIYLYISVFFRSTRTVTENGTLIINSLDLVDSGMYQCVARNDAGEAIKFAWIKVISMNIKFYF